MGRGLELPVAWVSGMIACSLRLDLSIELASASAGDAALADGYVQDGGYR
jgi:hypothetical protein